MLRVVAYHRIAEFGANPAVDDRTISATPSVFREQMRHIARYYRCVELPQVLDAVERGVALPRRAVLITFDDAYCDFAEIAWPILKELRLGATMFAPTAFSGDSQRVFWWDKLHRAFCSTARLELADTPIGQLSLRTSAERHRALRALQDYMTKIASDDVSQLVEFICAQLVETRIAGGTVLNWNQLRELFKDGVTIASHTRTHAILTQLSPKRICEEIRGSQQDLKTRIGVAWPVLCYPNGNYNDSVTKIVGEEGIRLAFTTIPSRNDLRTADLLRLGRTCITPRSSPAVFGARLLPLGARLDAWRHRRLRALLTRQLCATSGLSLK